MNEPICRFCALTKPPNELYDLTCWTNTEILADIKNIIKLLNFQFVNFADHTLPKWICVMCYQNLKDYYYFVDKIRFAQDILSYWYNNVDHGTRILQQSEIVQKRDDDSSSEDEEKLEIDESNEGANQASALAPAPAAAPPAPWSGETTVPFHEYVEHAREHRSELGEHSQIGDIKTTESNIKIYPESFLEQTMIVAPTADDGEAMTSSHTPAPPATPVRDLSRFFGPRVRERVEINSWKEYRWGCQYCSLEFEDQAVLRIHLKEVHITCFGFKCMDCSMVIKKYETFIKHVTSHRPALEKQCEYCDFGVADRNQYDLHIRQHRLDFECAVCGEYFHDKQVSRAHKRMFKAPKPSSMMTNNAEKSKSKELPCDTCGLLCPGLAALRRHKITHAKNKEDLTCKSCGKTFLVQSSLKAHNYNVHQIETFDCRSCKKSFGTAAGLQSHAESHVSAKPFKCDHCARRFRLNYHLQNHMHLHTDEMPHTCQKCSKSFKYKNALAVHERSHLEPYYHPQASFANRSDYNTQIPTQDPIYCAPAQMSIQRGPAQMPIHRDSAQMPIQRGPAQMPIQREHAQMPKHHEPAQLPIQREHAQMPKHHEPPQMPIQREPAQMPKHHEPAQMPIQREHAQMRTHRAPALIPIHREPAQMPIQRQSAQIPIHREPAQMPIHRAPAQIPKQREPAQMPTHHEPAQMPIPCEPAQMLTKEPIYRKPAQAQPDVTVRNSEVLKGWAEIFLQNANRNILN